MTSPEEDFWIEMSVMEISTQANFAALAYANVDMKADLSNDIVFSSIHSFLSHCAMISKMLKAESVGRSIGEVLGIPAGSMIHERRFRNHLEHYDKRLQTWIRDFGLNRLIGLNNIGPKRRVAVRNAVLIRHYDPETSVFTFIDTDFDLSAMYDEAINIKNIADQWIIQRNARRAARRLAI